MVSDDIEQSRELLSAKPQIVDRLGAHEKSSISKFTVFTGIGLYSATSELTVDGSTYFGYGRSQSAIEAASKAFGEAIERAIAFRFMNGDRSIAFESCAAGVSGGQVFVTHPSSDMKLPPRGLNSSNGWAVQFTREASIKNSVIESLERTILQTTFLSVGWDGFRLQERFEVGGRVFSVWLTIDPAFGYYGGLIECTLLGYAGKTYGYFVHPEGVKFKLANHLHSVFEAFEPALFIDQNPTFRPNSQDLIALRQYEHATCGPPSIRFEPRELRGSGTYRVATIILSLAEFFGLSTQLFASWAYGGNSVPLLAAKVSGGDVEPYIRSRLDSYGLADRWNVEVQIV